MTRYSAFTSRVAELGMRFVGSASREAYSHDAGWQGTMDLIPTDPDAIFYASDILALGGLDAMRAAGVFGSIGAVGFDDIPMASWPGYALTTYRQPIAALVERTLELLAGAEEPPRLHTLPGELVIRDSTSTALRGQPSSGAGSG
jgi:DNA-binding LacI/PurR family transcriptional regulator